LFKLNLYCFVDISKYRKQFKKIEFKHEA